MDLSSNFRILALYNQRMNDKLMEVCNQLTYGQLHQNTNSFFPTVMAHWNHILFGDLIMLQRLVANNLVSIDTKELNQLPTSKSTSDIFVSDLSELVKLRKTVDLIYIDITNQFTADSYNQLVRYTTTEEQVIERTVGEFCQHLFNHQTHHRGQLTCLLSQFDLDFGCTDLPVIVPERVDER
ncbi:DinB family protein [Vibrio comitans]